MNNRAERIKEIAYHRWEQEGRPDGPIRTGFGSPPRRNTRLTSPKNDTRRRLPRTGANRQQERNRLALRSQERGAGRTAAGTRQGAALRQGDGG
jgi:hypothetical protein